MTTKSAFPACLITFPFNVEGKTAPFFLAAEEYVAAALPADNYLFAWILPPTVVMGRNQVADAEVDLEICQREGIDKHRCRSQGVGTQRHPAFQRNKSLRKRFLSPEKQKYCTRHDAL